VKRPRGLSLPEVLVSFGIFTLLSIVLATSLREGTAVLRKAAASADVQGELRKARLAVAQDLARTSFAQTNSQPAPASLSGADGEALWFLSAVDPVTGEYRRKSDGTPFWQCNILYYMTVPSSHASLYGYQCAGGADGAGYEDRCPHKMLIRKVIDLPPATTAAETSEETLIPAAGITAYLTRPATFNLNGMNGEAGLKSARVQAHSLLTFRVQRNANPSYPREVLVDLRAVATRNAEKELKVGSVPLGQGRFTTQQLFSVFPTL